MHKTPMAILALLAAASLGRARVAHAQDGAHLPVQFEAHAGYHDAFGPVGVALAYDRGGRLAGGFGLGLVDTDGTLPIGIFGRLRMVSWGWGSLGAGLALSRERHSHGTTIDSHYISWWWTPAYRATGTLGLELAYGGLSLRFDGGIGYMLNGPQCSDWIYNSDQSVRGACDSPQFSDTVRTQSQDGRVARSLTATVGFRLPRPGHSVPVSGSAASLYKDPQRARRLSLWSTLAPLAGGIVVIGAGLASGAPPVGVAGAAAVVFGLAYGPSIGYIYAEEPGRGLGLGTLRALGLVLGTVALATGAISYESEYPSTSDHTGLQLLGLGTIIACLVSTFYDIAKAPAAAGRTNARHGLTELSVVPIVGARSQVAHGGLALFARF
jgi:hypothetical protein